MKQDITSDTLSDEAGVTSPDGQEAVGKTDAEGQGNDNVIAKTLSQTLGKQFKNDAEALKAVKDTQSFINDASEFNQAVKQLVKAEGITKEEAKKMLLSSVKAQPAIQNEELNKLSQDLEELKFFKANPDMEKHSNFFKEIRQETGKSYSQILESQVLKSYLDKASSFDEVEGKKSVLHSSGRLGRGADKMAQARQAQSDGKTDIARSNAVEAVMDAYDMRRQS